MEKIETFPFIDDVLEALYELYPKTAVDLAIAEEYDLAIDDVSHKDFWDWAQEVFPKIKEKTLPHYCIRYGEMYRCVETQTCGTCYCIGKYGTDEGDVIDLYDDSFGYFLTIDGTLDELDDVELAGLIDEVV